MVSEAVDGATRYLLYELFVATAGRPDAWQVLGNTEERLEIIIRDDRIGRIKVQSGLLTGEGRQLAQDSSIGR